MGAQRGARSAALPIQNIRVGRGGAGQRHTPIALPQESDSLHRRLGGSRGRFGRVWKIPFSPVFELQTVQPLASRCTDCAILAVFYEDSVWEDRR